jgi:hypothetical protein
MLLSDKEAQCRGRVSLPFSIRAKQANLLRFRGYLRTGARGPWLRPFISSRGRYL